MTKKITRIFSCISTIEIFSRANQKIVEKVSGA